MNTDIYSNWLEIDLSAINHNIQTIHQITRRPVMAIIKANAYGHGLVEVGKAIESGSTNWLGVARLEEALMLREAGVKANILVLGYTRAAAIHQVIQHDLIQAVFNHETAEAYSQEAQKIGKPVRLHVKTDTGMGRLGIFPEEGLAFFKWLHTLKGLQIEGLFTHFARADETDRTPTNEQIRRFTLLVQQLEAAGLRPQLVHAANSAASLYFPDAHFDMVRAGIAIYGLHPSAETPLPDGFRQALTWKARLASVKNLPSDHGIGYAHRYRTQKEERIGVIATGYADGLRRRLGNFALVHGKRVPVVGGVCMDQCMLQLDSIDNPQVGDEVVLVGRQGDAVITAEEVAVEWGTVNYDVMTGLAARVPRLYLP